MGVTMSWGYTEDAGGLQGHADRILIPADEPELLAILAEAQHTRTPVTIAGGGSGLTGGRVPRGGWLVSCEKFRRLDIAKDRAIAGGGVTLHELHAAAKATRQFYPPDPTETMAYVGGTIACNSSGSRSFKYGATRRWIRRVRVALMGGNVIDARRGDPIDFDVPSIPQPRAKKHSAGYPLRPGMDWVDLFCGSEGTLGVVIEAELELLPIPESLLNGIIFFASGDACFDALEAFRAIPDLRMLEYVDQSALDLIRTRYPEIPRPAEGALIIEHIIHRDSDVDAWHERLRAHHGMEDLSWFGDTDADRERFRKFRHALPETCLELSARRGFMKLGTDFSVPDEHCRAMMAYYRERMDQIMPGEYCIFGHLGDSHAHVNMMPSTQERFDGGSAVQADFAAKAVSYGGSIAAEHGLGKRKAKLLPLQYTPAEIEAMMAVKRRLDPQWLLGQGNLFPNQAAGIP
jgi:FAD/FMN-containing dehydrogenase